MVNFMAKQFANGALTVPSKKQPTLPKATGQSLKTPDRAAKLNSSRCAPPSDVATACTNERLQSVLEEFAFSRQPTPYLLLGGMPSMMGSRLSRTA